MSSLTDLLKGTLLSLKQIKDLLRGIITSLGIPSASTLWSKLTNIENKIDDIDFTPVEQRIDSAAATVIEELRGSDDDADLSAIKTDTGNLLLGIEDLKSDIGDLDEILQSINGDTVDNIVNNYIGEQLVLMDDMLGNWSDSSSDDSSDE